MNRTWLLYAAVGAPVFLGALDLTVISAVLPVVIDELDLVVPDGVRQASWLVVAYLLAYAIGVLGGGRIGDRLGPHRVLTWSVALFGIASLGLVAFIGPPTRLVQQIAYRAAEVRPDPDLVRLGVLTGWRVLQALAAGAVVPAGMAYGWHRLRARSWLGFVAAVDLLGWTFGHLYGGLVVRWFDWPVAFWANIPIAAGSLVLLRKMGDRTAHEPSRFPTTAFLAGSAGVAAIVIGLGGGDGASLPVRPAWIAVGAVGLAVASLGAGSELLPWGSIRAEWRSMVANVGVGFVVFVVLAAVPLFVSVLVESDTQLAAWQSGWALSAFTVPLAGSAFLGGRFGGTAVEWVAWGAAIAAMAWVARWEPSISSIVPTLAVAGTGLGWLFAPLAERPLRATPDERAGAMSSGVILARLLGMAAGSSVLTGFILAGLADIEVEPGVSRAFLDVFHRIPVLALPALMAVLPYLMAKRSGPSPDPRRLTDG